MPDPVPSTAPGLNPGSDSQPTDDLRSPQPAGRLPTWAAAFALGAFAQVAQLVVLREVLAVCRGTETLVGFALGGSLLWTATGTAASGLARRGRQARVSGPPVPLTAWGLAAGTVLLWLEVVALRLAGGGSTAGPGLTGIGAAVLAAQVPAPVGLLMGWCLGRVLAAAGHGERAAVVYQADCWGAVAGGLAFAFLLLPSLDPLTMAPTVAAALCGGLAATRGVRSPVRVLLPGVLCAGAAACAVLAGLDARLHAWRWQRRLPGAVLLQTVDARVGQVAVLRVGGATSGERAVYLDGALAASLPDHRPGVGEDVVRALFLLGQVPEARRVLLAGGGLAGLPSELVRLGVDRVDVVEPDAVLLALAERGPTEHLTYVAEDLRRYLKRRAADTGQDYDLVVLDLPLPVSAFVGRTCTVECFREAARRLTDGGVLVVSIPAAAAAPGEVVLGLSAALRTSLRTVFADVQVAPGSRHTLVAARTPGRVSLDPAELAGRLARRGGLPGWLKAGPEDTGAAGCQGLLETVVQANETGRLREALDATPAVPNTDARPAAFRLGLRVWGQVTAGDGSGRWWPRVWGLSLLVPAALPLLLGRWPRRRDQASPGRHGPEGWAVRLARAGAVAAGFFGMAGEIVLLYQFQSTYGHVYGWVGALLALFMAGLAAGGWSGGRLLAGGWDPARVAAAALLSAGGLCVAMALAGSAPGSAAGTGAYAVWLPLSFVGPFVAAGVLAGLAFPALVGIVGRAGALEPGVPVYAADLVGSAAGALLTAALFLPYLGTVGAWWVTAAVLAAGGLAVAVVRPREEPRGEGRRTHPV